MQDHFIHLPAVTSFALALARRDAIERTASDDPVEMMRVMDRSEGR
jgi:hypothetical protein